MMKEWTLQDFVDAYIGGSRFLAIDPDGDILGATKTESEAFAKVKAARGADGRYGATPKLHLHVALNVNVTEPVSVELADAPSVAKLYLLVSQAISAAHPQPVLADKPASGSPFAAGAPDPEGKE